MNIKHALAGLGSLVLAACAGQEARLPGYELAAVQSQRQIQQNASLNIGLDYYEKAHGLLWPIIVANTEYCPKVTQELGFRLADLDRWESLSRGLSKRELRALGFDKTVRISYVIPGSPASEAGLGRMDRIVTINDETVPIGTSLKQMSKQLRAARKDGMPVSLSVLQQSGERKTVTLAPVETCAIRRFTIDNSGDPGASAGSTVMKFSKGLLVSGEDDRMLQYVMAHELAHLTQRHVPKTVRNRLVTGSQIYGTAAGLAALPFDILLSLAGQGLDVPLTARAAQLTDAPWAKQFEDEADYLAVYYLARAGIEIDGIERVFTYLSEQKPKGTYVGLNHSDLPERVLAVRATVAEVKEKQAGGQPLTPEGVAPKQPD